MSFHINRRHLFVCLAAATLMVVSIFNLVAGSREVLKIAITASGQITADGRPSTIEELIPILRELAKKKGEVWYYREEPEADPHPNAMKVLAAIVDCNLPVLLSTKPDYSDSVDEKGRSVPRH
jgi:hypothetical protein